MRVSDERLAQLYGLHRFIELSPLEQRDLIVDLHDARAALQSIIDFHAEPDDYGSECSPWIQAASHARKKARAYFDANAGVVRPETKREGS